MDVFRSSRAGCTRTFLIVVMLWAAVVCVVGVSTATDPAADGSPSCELAETLGVPAGHPSCQVAPVAGAGEAAGLYGYPGSARDRFHLALEMVMRVDLGARARALENLAAHCPAEAPRATQLRKDLVDLERCLPQLDRALTFRRTAGLAAADVVLDTAGRTGGH